MLFTMKTISLSVSESDYEAFRRAARGKNRPIAELIREAMTVYRTERLEARTPLTELPALAGHRLVVDLPSRDELQDELIGDRGGSA